MFGFFSSVVDSVCDFAGGTIDAVCDISGGVLDVASNVAGGAVDLGSEIGSGAFNLAGELGNAALDVFGVSVDGVISLAGEAGSGISTVVVDVTGGVADMVGDFLQLLAQDGTDAEAEAARQALERKIARREQALQDTYRQHKDTVEHAMAGLGVKVGQQSLTARHQAVDLLNQENRTLSQAISAGMARKSDLEKRLTNTRESGTRRALEQELHGLNQAMNPLYRQRARTQEQLNALQPAGQYLKAQY